MLTTNSVLEHMERSRQDHRSLWHDARRHSPCWDVPSALIADYAVVFRSSVQYSTVWICAADILVTAMPSVATIPKNSHVTSGKWTDSL